MPRKYVIRYLSGWLYGVFLGQTEGNPTHTTARPS